MLRIEHAFRMCEGLCFGPADPRDASDPPVAVHVATLQPTNSVMQVVAMGPRDMRMFYHSFDVRAQKWTVGTATSKDGFVWTKRGPIFSGSESASDFDGKGAAACHVVRDYTTKRYVGAFLMYMQWVSASLQQGWTSHLHQKPARLSYGRH